MNPTTFIWGFGIVTGILITVLLLKCMNKDGKTKTKYDERQQRARGEAYKYGFFATLITCAIFMLLETSKLISILDYTTYFIAIVIGVIVQFSYAIFHDAYIGLNTNMKKYTIFMVIVGIINLLGGIMPLIHGEFLVDGHFDTSFINLLCSVMLLILAGELAVKQILDKKED